MDSDATIEDWKAPIKTYGKKDLELVLFETKTFRAIGNPRIWDLLKLRCNCLASVTVDVLHFKLRIERRCNGDSTVFSLHVYCCLIT